MKIKHEMTVKENLEKARQSAHKTMIKNGHYKRMAQARWGKKLSPAK